MCFVWYHWRAHTVLTDSSSLHYSKYCFIIILSLPQISRILFSCKQQRFSFGLNRKNSEGVKNPWDPWDPCGKIQHSSLCSQGFYHEPFEARLVAAFHRAGISGIELVILLFHVVKIFHYLHHLVSGAVMLLQRRTKQAVGLGMTGITLLDMLNWVLIHVASHL